MTGNFQSVKIANDEDASLANVHKLFNHTKVSPESDTTGLTLSADATIMGFGGIFLTLNPIFKQSLIISYS